MTTKTKGQNKASGAADAAKAATETAQKAFDSFAEVFSSPAFDAQDVFSYGRQNAEAVVEANRIMFEGLKDMAQKHVDLAKDNAAALTQAANDALANKTPEESVSFGIEFGQSVFSKNLKALRKANDDYMTANQKALAVLQKRYVDGVETVKSAAK